MWLLIDHKKINFPSGSHVQVFFLIGYCNVKIEEEKTLLLL
jgi:hypothetical protein